jgi:hypothetical protein
MPSPQGLVSVAKEELLSVFREALTENRVQQERDAVEGIKYFRLPVLYATPASGTVVLGESWAGQPYTGQVTGPASGYVWSIRRLSCNGLGTGTSPDILNIYRNGHSQPPVWQLNGNNWGYSFGPTELLLLPGEKLIAASLGSLTSTVQISLAGDAIEVPQAMIGKLVL